MKMGKCVTGYPVALICMISRLDTLGYLWLLLPSHITEPFGQSRARVRHINALYLIIFSWLTLHGQQPVTINTVINNMHIYIFINAVNQGFTQYK